MTLAVLKKLKNKNYRMTLISFGAVLGLVLGFAFAFVVEFFDHSLGTRNDVEDYLGVPVLASLSDSPEAANPLMVGFNRSATSEPD